MISENAWLDASGGANGGAGGRIYLNGMSFLENRGEENIIALGGSGSIPGGPGTVNYNRPFKSEELKHFTGTLSINTSDATITHSDGSIYYGLIEESNYKHSDGNIWSYSICRFVFEEIHLGGGLTIETSGKNSLLIESSSGDFILETNLIANGNDPSTENQTGGTGKLGGFSGVRSGNRIGNGPGASKASSAAGHGASYGGLGSGDSSLYGDHALSFLIGGSSGGSGSSSGSGAGGGAIWLKAAGELRIMPNTVISANGGDGREFSASGSGGAIRLEGKSIINEGKVEANSGTGIQAFEQNQNRGSGGGRISFIADQETIVGNVEVHGESSTKKGTVYIGGNYDAANLILDSGSVTFDTKTGCFYTSHGAHGTGTIAENQMTSADGETWQWKTCTFEFGKVSLSSEVSVRLTGDKALLIKTVAGGDIRISSDLIMDGEDASSVNGYGGSGSQIHGMAQMLGWSQGQVQMPAK